MRIKAILWGFAASILLFSGCNKCEEAPAPSCNCPEAVACTEAPAQDVKSADSPEASKPGVKEMPAEQRDLEGQKEVFDFMKQQKTYYLATVEDDQPRVRPFGTVEIFEENLYIQTGRKKNVSHQMEQNGKIELCTFDGEKWLRLSATAIADDRIEAQKHMLDAYPSLQKMYQPGDGNTVVYKLVDVTATFYSFGSDPREIRF